VSPNGICVLGHARLSIIDLSPAGHQPMFDVITGNTIVFNGEIYNFQELRKKLVSAGDLFNSHSDTEVILALYRRYSIDCLKFLRGMFAIAIWDEQRQLLFLARDRVGKKPLNYAVTKTRLSSVTSYWWYNRRAFFWGDSRELAERLVHVGTAPRS
jgi:asparagine synthase (glutamine-hydrolysing)